MKVVTNRSLCSSVTGMRPSSFASSTNAEVWLGAGAAMAGGVLA
jgi:hypothetical protein